MSAASAGLHSRRRSWHSPGRACPRHAQAADRGCRRAVPRSPAAAAGRPRRQSGCALRGLSGRADRAAHRQPNASGCAIAYSFDAPGLDGTLGAILRARDLLGERFLVLYGDTYLRIDYAAAAEAWERSGLPAMMSVLRNENRWDTSNVVYADGRVLAYDKHAPRPEMRWIDYGLGGLEQSALDLAPPGTRNLSDLYHQLAGEGRLYGFEATERFYEIGTPEGLAATDAFLQGLGRPGRRVAR